MGSGQVLRAAGAVAALLCFAGAASAKTLTIDLRPAGREELAKATAAYGDLRCADARVAAADALRAALEKDPQELARPVVEKALTIELLCADGAGDRDAARAAAGRLRNLRRDEQPPDGVSAAIWERYPAVDAATNVFGAKVTITTDPPSAAVSVDLAAPTLGPSDRILSPGTHLVVVTHQGHKRTFTTITVEERKNQTVHLALVASSKLEDVELTSRTAQDFPKDESVAALGEQEVVVVLGDQARVYRDGKRVAEGKHSDLAALLAKGEAPPEAVAPPRKPEQDRKSSRSSWWIYAAAVGAVIVGGAFVYAIDSGDDVQRIEVGWP